MVKLTLGIALALFGVAGALLLFPDFTRLSVPGGIVVLIGSIWLTVLALSHRAESSRAEPASAASSRAEASWVSGAEFHPAEPSLVGPLEGVPNALVDGASASGAAALDRALAIERTAALERARRLTESSFLAGSNALVNVRAVLRGLQDGRERLDEAVQRSETDLSQDTGALPISQAFESVLVDLGRLIASARRLGSLLTAAAAPTGAASAGSSASPGNPAGSVSPPPSTIDGGFMLARLKLEALAAELEYGLIGLSTEVRALKRARLMRPSLNGKSDQRRGAPEISWRRAFDRLEAQVSELGEHVAGFTRDAEQLSRELDHLR